MKGSSCDKSDLEFVADAVLLDIEGTTTCIKFVRETLFPYVVEEVERHLTDTWTTEETRQDVQTIRKQVALDAGSEPAHKSCDPAGASAPKSHGSKDDPDDADNNVDASVAEIASVVKDMVKEDRKIGCLKTLQGHMWRRGYAEGKLKGHVFEDVPGALRSWLAAGADLFIYSSGSVEAQKLLFGHTEHGDLNKLFSGNYDTAMGLKTDPASYRAIAEAIAVPPERVLFVTDIAAEARAARECGMQVLLSVRPGNVSGLHDGETFPSATSFADVRIVNDKKRKSQSQS